MKVLNEKYLLKRCASGLVPPSVLQRSKQPYRAPEGSCFFRGPRQDYVDTLLSPARIAQDGIFNPRAVDGLVKKFHQERAIGSKDNMALVGVLSTQLVVDKFTRTFRGDSGRVEHRAATTAIHHR
jgi:asparagine synthase (glutamine-hydrolysing)